MKEFEFDRAARTPLISTLLSGPSGKRRLTLVLDTGAGITQIHAPTLSLIGYGEQMKIKNISMVGASGENQKGYLIQSDMLLALGKRIENAPIGAFDFSDLASTGIDGLLGFDLIKELHIEMDDPKGMLRVF